RRSRAHAARFDGPLINPYAGFDLPAGRPGVDGESHDDRTTATGRGARARSVGGALPPRTERESRSRGVARARGSGHPDDPGGQPDEVAPRARHVVFRALLPAGARPGLRAGGRALPLPLQLLLLHGRRDVPPPPARPLEPADRHRDPRFPRPRRRRDALADRAPRRRPRLRVPRRARPPPRAAAPGAVAHGYQARLLLEPARAGLLGAPRKPDRESRAARLHRPSRRHLRDRLRRRNLLLRQRNTSPPNPRPRSRARSSPRYERRVP